MRRCLSPTIRNEIMLCNTQQNNKRCLNVSITDESEFVLEGYTFQAEDKDKDIEYVKMLPKEHMTLLLYNINEYTHQCKWIILFWIPDESAIRKLQNDSNKISTSNPFVKCFEKDKIITGSNEMKKLIYYNMLHHILDLLESSEELVFEVRNFMELDEYIRKLRTYPHEMNNNNMNNNYNVQDKNEDSMISSANNYVNSYFDKKINERNCISFIITEELKQNVELFTQEDSMCINIFTFNNDDYILSSKYMIIKEKGELYDFLPSKPFYAVYKIIDTYTLFFFCNSSFPKVQRFLYSMYKPKVIEYFKSLNIQIFLSVEMNDKKCIIDFINLDLKKRSGPKEIEVITHKAHTTRTNNTGVKNNNTHTKKTSQTNMSKQKKDSISKKVGFLQRSQTMKKKNSTSSTQVNDPFLRSSTTTFGRVSNSLNSNKGGADGDKTKESQFLNRTLTRSVSLKKKITYPASGIGADVTEKKKTLNKTQSSERRNSYAHASTEVKIPKTITKKKKIVDPKKNSKTNTLDSIKSQNPLNDKTGEGEARNGNFFMKNKISTLEKGKSKRSEENKGGNKGSTVNGTDYILKKLKEKYEKKQKLNYDESKVLLTYRMKTMNINFTRSYSSYSSFSEISENENKEDKDPKKAKEDLEEDEEEEEEEEEDVEEAKYNKKKTKRVSIDSHVTPLENKIKKEVRYLIQ